MSYSDDYSLDQDVDDKFKYKTKMAEQKEKKRGRVRLTNVRCTFPNLIELREYEGKSQYNITLLVPKTDAQQIGALARATKEIVEEKWPLGGKTSEATQCPEK